MKLPFKITLKGTKYSTQLILEQTNTNHQNVYECIYYDECSRKEFFQSINELLQKALFDLDDFYNMKYNK